MDYLKSREAYGRRVVGCKFTSKVYTNEKERAGRGWTQENRPRDVFRGKILKHFGDISDEDMNKEHASKRERGRRGAHIRADQGSSKNTTGPRVAGKNNINARRGKGVNTGSLPPRWVAEARQNNLGVNGDTGDPPKKGLES